MKKSDKSLLPLRGKISPPTILNSENHANEQRCYNKEIANSMVTRERLFSASSRSASSSKHESSLSDVRSMTPPFTPPANINGDHGFLFRRPSEHFLEVLEEHKLRETLPKVLSASCLPPLRKAFQGEDSSKRSLKGTKVAFNDNYEATFSRPAGPDRNSLFLVSETRRQVPTPNHVNEKLLRKTNSLPLIKTGSALTSGIDYVNVSGFQNHTTSAITSQENKLDECVDRTHNLTIDEYLDKDLCDEDEELDEDDNEQTLEKFSMICHWLKDCEKAKVI